MSHSVRRGEGSKNERAHTRRFMKFRAMRCRAFRSFGDVMRTHDLRGSPGRPRLPNLIILVGCLAIFIVIVAGGTIGSRQEDHRERLAVFERY
jgi:hypothetical protein